MELDKRLKVARKNAGLSQNEVAEKLHISRQAISQWENGRSYPDLDNLTLLSQLYQVDIYELNGQNKPADPPIQINKESEKENNYKNKDKDEGLVLLIFSCILFLIAPFGVFIAPIIIWRNKKTNLYYKLVYIVCIGAILYNLYTGYGNLSDY